MRRNLVIWAALVALYGTFLFWHAPRHPPLDPTEWRMALTQADFGAEALSEGVAALFDSDDGRPFYMINILDTRTVAAYPDGQFPDITEGAEAARRYGAGIIPELLRRGSYPMFLASPQATLLESISAETARFEEVGIVRYRSRRDFLDMITGAPFQSILVHKWASLEGTIVIPAVPGVAVDLTIAVPLFLLGIGLGLSLRRRRVE